MNREVSIGVLGVQFYSQLLFDKHIESIVAKAYAAMKFLMRTYNDFTDTKPIKIL